MDKYLVSLEKFKSVCFTPKERLLLKKIALYIKDEITMSDLIANLSEKNVEFVVFVLNKIAIDCERSLKYYVELPCDRFFNHKYPYAIWAGNTKRFGFFHNELEFQGPMVKSSGKYNSENFMEINGDFYLPNGLIINRNEWLKILKNNPNLMTYMYKSLRNERSNFFDFSSEVKNYLDSNINFGESNNGQYIDNISYEENKNYFNIYNVMDGKTGSFKKIILNRHM